MTPPTGPRKHIGRFEIHGEIGRGGFGKVFRAYDPKVGRVVAIKVLESDGTAGSVSRFQKEATAAGNLHHKNIVTIHEFGEDDGVQYLVMEYLDGEDLQKTLRTRKPLTPLRKMIIMSQVAEGLHCAHSSGVLHRDVKPANIMLLADGGVKIMDFGIARLVKDTSTRLTQQGYLIGTVLYMAPELLLGSEVDVLCDIWSYGVIYYELLAGRNPFETGNAPSEMYKITREEPPDLPYDVCPEVLQPVIRRLLAKDRELRFQSLEDVRFETEPILRDLQKQEAQRLLPQARNLCSCGDWDAAHTLIRSILELDPPSQEARVLREQIQREIHKRSVRPRVEALIRRGDEEAERRHFTEAIELLDSARKLDSTDERLEGRLQYLRAAKDRNDRAEQLLSNARHELRQNQLTKAFEHASEALRADPEYRDAAQLLAQIQLRIEEREKERNIEAGLHKARGLLAIESFDEALALLGALDLDHPGHSEIRDLMGRTLEQKNERERRRRLAGGLNAAKEQLRAGALSECLQALKELAREFPHDPEVSELIGYVRQELNTRERTQAVETLNREVMALTQAHQYDRALEIIQSGLRSYPDELVLSRLLRSVLSSKQAHEQEQAFQEGLERIQELRNKGRFQEGLGIVSALLERHPNDAELVAYDRKLREELQKQERDAAVARHLEKAQALLQGDRAGDAVTLLQTALQLYTSDPRLTAALRRASDAARDQELQRYVASQLSALRELERHQDWNAAQKLIRNALAQYPDRPELIEAEQRIDRATVQAEQTRRIVSEQATIQGHLNAKRWDEALARIQSDRAAYPEEEGFRRLAAEAHHRRDQEIKDLVEEARKCLLAGSVDEAEHILNSGLKGYSDEPEVATFARELSLQKVRREEAERREHEKQEYIRSQLAMAEGHERARNWPAALAVLRNALQQDPSNPELTSAERRIADAIRSDERNHKIAVRAENIRQKLQHADWRAAITLLDKACADHADEPVFQELLTEAKQQRVQAWDEVVSQTREMISAGDLDAADSAIRSSAGAFSDEPQFKALVDEIARDRTRRLAESKRRPTAFGDATSPIQQTDDYTQVILAPSSKRISGRSNASEIPKPINEPVGVPALTRGRTWAVAGSASVFLAISIAAIVHFHSTTGKTEPGKVQAPPPSTQQATTPPVARRTENERAQPPRSVPVEGSKSGLPAAGIEKPLQKKEVPAEARIAKQVERARAPKETESRTEARVPPPKPDARVTSPEPSQRSQEALAKIESSPAPVQPAQTQQTPPQPIQESPASSVFFGPSGKLVWTGELANNDRVTIASTGPDRGVLHGDPMPFGIPVRISVGPSMSGLSAAQEAGRVIVRNTSGRTIRYFELHWERK